MWLVNLLIQCDVKEGHIRRSGDGVYDLRQAKEDFNLWDGVHGRDVLKHLEQFSKWEPGKKERERREKLAMVAMMEAEKAMEDSENGEGLAGTKIR